MHPEWALLHRHGHHPNFRAHAHQQSAFWLQDAGGSSSKKKKTKESDDDDEVRCLAPFLLKFRPLPVAAANLGLFSTVPGAEIFVSRLTIEVAPSGVG